MNPQRQQRPDDSFVTTSLGKGGLSTRQLLILATLAVLLIATVSGAVILVGGGFDSETTTQGIIHPPTPIPTETPTPGLTSGSFVPPGFQAAGSPNAQTIAFSTDTVYLCGVDTQGAGFLAVSHDRGVTWTITVITAQGTTPGGACSQVAINEANPRQIAVTILPCAVNCSNGSFGENLYQSQDAGATWQQANLPDSSANIAYGLVWVNNALWVGCQGRQLLAVSVNNQPLAWVTPPQHVQPPLTGIDELYFSHHSLFVVQSPTTYRTDDQGKTWRIVTPHDGNASINLTGESPGGATLLGVTTDTRAEISTDDGASWQALPETTDALVQFQQTPDGTLVAQTARQGNAALVILMRDTPTWANLSTFSAGTANLAGAIWDSSGHPTAIWASGVGTGLSLGFFVEWLNF